MSSAKGKRTAKGGYLKTTFVCKFCFSEPGFTPWYFEIYWANNLFEVVSCLRQNRRIGVFSKYEDMHKKKDIKNYYEPDIYPPLYNSEVK